MSVASAWELWIKQAKDRVKVPDDFAAALRDAGFHHLDILLSHAKRAAELPMLHGDPFDRLLVAQAVIEDLVLVTHDGKLLRYEGVRTLKA